MCTCICPCIRSLHWQPWGTHTCVSRPRLPGVPRMGTEGSTVLSPLWRGLPPVAPSAVSSSASCALPPRFEAVRTARKFTRTTLQQWDLPGLFDDVSLVVSELVTNSLRYALPGEPVGAG